MRKSYLTLAAVAAIMASCSNEVLIDDIKSGDTDVAIGFSTFSDKATKASTPENLEKYHTSFTVYGTKKNGTTVQKVFDAVDTDYRTQNTDETGAWHYYPARYWDKQATYNFIAVAPNDDIVEYNVPADTEVGANSLTFTTVTGGYTLLGQNLQGTPKTAEIEVGFDGESGNDTDILTSAVVSEDGATRTSGSTVDLVFKHILAKLNVSVAKSKALHDATVTIKGLTIKSLKDNGTYTESSYVAATPASGWIASYSATPSTYKLAWPVTANDTKVLNTGSYKDPSDLTSTYTIGAPLYFIESLVMPQTIADGQCEIELNYNIYTEYDSDGNGTIADTEKHSEDYSFKMDLQDAFANFMDRCNYTLKFTISPEVIVFDATATEWDDKDAKEITINN